MMDEIRLKQRRWGKLGRHGAEKDRDLLLKAGQDGNSEMADDPSSSNSKKPLQDLFLIAALVVYAVLAILAFWNRPYHLFFLLLPAPATLLSRLGREFFAVAAAGAILGPITEAACVLGGLWSYAERGGLPLIPIWLLAIWACFPTALWLIVRSFQGSIPAARPGTLSLAAAGIALEVIIFVSLQKNLVLLIAFCLLLAAGALAAWPKKSTATLMAAGGILGPACEALPVAAGAWNYSRADLWGMPLWLPLAYALFAVLVAEAGLALLPRHIRAGSGLCQEDAPGFAIDRPEMEIKEPERR